MSVSTAEVDEAVLAHFAEHGWAVLPDVLGPDEVAAARAALERAADASEAKGVPTRMEFLDPGGRNIRVYDLLEHDPVFVDLVVHPAVLPLVAAVLHGDVAVSNFTANTALPGSRSMNPHNDQSTVMPEPWTTCYALNAIWCLDDTDEGNGATRYLPGSHRYTCFAEVPDDPTDGMRSFEARAGSVILMDGRIWHTSGANTSTDRERALLFAFYTRSFLRHQTNWNRSLSRETRRSLTPELREMLGLGAGNMALGAYLADL
ncbi:MAG: phytanoyl-CoA dioxygenase family protein [Acidimicrobiales bacterium]|nr:phytanoyl-CoA dioxygenase family protein [Acidimicrobiales bacterium]